MPLLTLHQGCWNGNVEGLQKILKDWINETFDDSGYTGFHIAAQAGNVEILNMLLKYGANPNVQCHHARQTAMRAQSNDDKKEIPDENSKKRSHTTAFERL